MGDDVKDHLIRVPMNVCRDSLEDKIRLNSGWHLLDDYRCANCTSVGTVRRKVGITRTSSHVVLQFLVFNNQAEKINSTKLKGVPSSKVILGGKTCVPTAGIFHHGDQIHNGHYTCLVKAGNGWKCANDSQIQKRRWPLGSKDLYMILLTKT